MSRGNTYASSSRRRREESPVERSDDEPRRNGRRRDESVDDDEANNAMDEQQLDRLSRDLPTLEQFKRRQQAQNQEEGEEDVVFDERSSWSKSNFEDQPVSYDAAKEGLTIVRRQCRELEVKIDHGIQAIQETALQLEAIEPDHDDLNKLQKHLMDLLDAEQENATRIAVIDEISTELRNRPELTNIEKELKRREDERLQGYRSQTARQKFMTNDKYIEFRTAVWEVNHGDEGIPPISNWLPRADADEESDDEFQYGGQTQTYRCPITLQIFEDACKSTVCGHHYSFAAVQSFIAQNRGETKCPVSACSRPLKKTDIVRDPGMQRMADRFKARQALRDEADDDFARLDED